MVKKSTFLEKLFGRRGKTDEVRAKPQAQKGGVARDPRANAQAARRQSAPASRPTQQDAARAKQDAARAKQAAQAARSAPASQPPKASKPTNGASAKAPEVAKPTKPSQPIRPTSSAPAAKATSGAPAATNAGANGGSSSSAASGNSGALSRVLGGKSREEAAAALNDGFRELGTLLQGIGSRMDEQGKQSASLNEKFTDLPAMAQAQVQFMTTISQHLTEQKAKTGELLDKLGGLPGLLDGIHKTLERQAAVEERTEKNLKDFRATMDKIHDSIGVLTTESKKATESFERANSRQTRVFEETQKSAFTTFEKTQSAQLTELSNAMNKAAQMNRGMIIMLTLVFAAMVALFAIVLGPK